MESKSLATPDTKFFEVISSKAVVIAKPGIKIIIAERMVIPTLNSGKTKCNKQAKMVTTKEIKDSNIVSK